MARVLACPTCNASLPEEARPGASITCEYCGNNVLVPGQQHAPHPHQQPPPQAPAPVFVVGQLPDYGQTVRTARSGCLGVTVIIIVVVVALAGVGIAIATRVIGGVSDSIADGLGGGGPEPTVAFGSSGTGVGQFDDAREIAVDGEGFVYVGEFASRRVQRFTREGEVSGQWIVETADEVPLSELTASRDGTVIAGVGFDLYRFRGSTGDPLGQIAADPNAVLQFYSAAAPLPDGGTLVVRSDGPTTLIWLSREGQVTRQVMPDLSPAERIDRIAVDGQGTIYALGTRLMRGTPQPGVLIFDREGTFQSFFGGQGDEPGQFRLTLGLAVDNQSRVAVSGLGGVQLFDSGGRFLEQIDVNPTPYGLAFDSENLLWVSTGQEVRAYEVGAD